MSDDDAIARSRAAQPRPNSRVIQQAAAWLVKLDEGALGDKEQQQLAAWRGQSPEHEQAWRAAVELKSLLGAVPDALGKQVLGRRRIDRRMLLKGLAGVMVAAPAGWVAYRQLPWEIWLADFSTAAGEQRRLALPDSSRLHLNTASARRYSFRNRQPWLAVTPRRNTGGNGARSAPLPGADQPGAHSRPRHPLHRARDQRQPGRANPGYCA